MSVASGDALLSPSTHVSLLQHYHERNTNAKVTLPFDANATFALIPSPQPSPAFESPAAAADAPVDPAAVLPLPIGWATLRSQQLRLQSERRMLEDLRIDTSHPSVLRRGLWLACASMYLPQVIGAELSLAADPIAPADATVAASAAVAVESAAPSLECVGDIRVPKSFDVSVVEGGITNQLYRCSLRSHADQPVLVRIYGPRTELVIDRSKENDVVDVLSGNGEGPKIFGRFANGRLESWLCGRSLSPPQMREPHLSALIAATLSRLHRQEMPFAREAVIARVLRSWAAIAAQVSFETEPLKQQLLDALRLPEQIAATESYIAGVQSSPFGAASPVVFAHNDLLSGNVMYDEAGDRVALVDFEYGNYNPRGFDFANHFCECCGFECDWSVFPRVDAQLHFIRHYLAASRGVGAESVGDDECHAAYAEVQCWLGAPHLFWGLWAVVQSRYSPIQFDYLSYAQQRFTAFRDMLPHFDKWIKVDRMQLAEAVQQQREKEQQQQQQHQ